MKNIKMCSLLVFSLVSILLSAQAKEVTSSSAYRSNSGMAAKDVSIKNVAYIVNPAVTVEQSALRNEGTSPTTYSKILVTNGTGFTKNGDVVSECLCRFASNNSYVSQPRMTFKADQDGNFNFQYFVGLSSDMTMCKATVKDIKTGKTVMNAWYRP
jgi:hypothetical protein